MSDKSEGKGESANTNSQKLENSNGSPSPKRIKLSDNVNEIKKMSRETLLSKFQEQDKYIDRLEEKTHQTSNAGELTSLRESEEKLKLQQQESTRRENVLVMRLATKEQEMQELLTQIHDLKQAQNPAGAQLRSTLLDPAVNIVFQRMRSELDETKEKLEQAQNDLSAWKFTPDSVTGKKLMAKCRMLIQENQELGRQLSQGRVAQLEAELALQKKYSEELKTSQDELNEFVIQLDEEVEGMQSTILTLQQQLKGVKNELLEEKQNGEKQVEQIRILEQNLDLARTQPPSPVEKPTDMQCDTDRTEGPGPEDMETECSRAEPGENNMKTEDKDSTITAQIAQSDYENVKQDGPSVLSGYNNVSSEVENVQPDVITCASNVSRKAGNVNPRLENERFDTINAIPAVENVRCEAEGLLLSTENANSSSENAKLNTEDSESSTENAKFKTENAKSSMENEMLSTENSMSNTEKTISNTEKMISNTEKTISNPENAEDGAVRTVEKVSQLSSPLEPNVRKSAGTPPCSTTFSISHLLGEPKRTPSPIHDAQGGDAVVTKIPYIGGYTDPAERTEGLLNGEGKDGTQPVVT